MGVFNFFFFLKIDGFLIFINYGNDSMEREKKYWRLGGFASKFKEKIIIKKEIK